MKNILSGLFLMCIISCNQNNSGIAGGDPEISFDLGASHHTYVGAQTTANPIGVYAIKQKAIPGVFNAYYSFAGMSNPNSQIILLIATDSLKVQTYHTTTGTGSQIITTGGGYTFLNSTDFLDITISSYQNGIVNGTFSGKLTNSSNTSQQTTVTNGQIKNVKLRYL